MKKILIILIFVILLGLAWWFSGFKFEVFPGYAEGSDFLSCHTGYHAWCVGLNVGGKINYNFGEYEITESRISGVNDKIYGCKPITKPSNTWQGYCPNYCANYGSTVVYYTYSEKASGKDEFGCDYKIYERTDYTCRRRYSYQYYSAACDLISTTKLDVKYGGAGVTSENWVWNCGSSVTIKKNGNIIYNEPTRLASRTFHTFVMKNGTIFVLPTGMSEKEYNIMNFIEKTKGGIWIPNVTVINQSDILFSIFGPNSYTWKAEYFDCSYVRRSFIFYLPSNLFNFSIESPESSYFRGTNATFDMVIYNNWRDNIEARVKTNVCQPTFFGEACYDYIQNINLTLGKNVVTHSIPTGLVVEKLKVTPSLELYLPQGFLTGSNEACSSEGGKLWPIEKCYWHNETITEVTRTTSGQLVQKKLVQFWPKMIWAATGNTTTIMINPNPIYLTGRDCTVSGCPSGYYCQTESKLCIRDDLKNLGCMQLGCPVTPDKTYECTSAGVCAEIVYVYKDCKSDPNVCPSGTTCDQNSGVCIKTEIFKDVVQCTTAADCYVPCKGVVTTCENNRCQYSGECEITEVQCFTDSDCPAAPCKGVSPKCNPTNNRCEFIGSCEPVYLTIDCSTQPCPKDYKCVKVENQSVCQKTVYVEQGLDCRTLGCPKGYVCSTDKVPPICEKIAVEKLLPEGIESYYLPLILFSIISVAGIIWYIRKK